MHDNRDEDMEDTPKKPKGASKSSFEFIDSNLLKTVLPIK